MVIYGVMPRALTHLSGTHADWVDMGPPAFGILEIGLCRVTQPVEVEIVLAADAMVVKVKFRDNEFKFFNESATRLHSRR
jgi:hypothetical protein